MRYKSGVTLFLRIVNYRKFLEIHSKLVRYHVIEDKTETEIKDI